MAEARDINRSTLLEDRRMWRLLLARLHPDVAGNPELFLFASAVREEVCGGGRPKGKLVHADNKRKTERPAEHSLREWQEAMNFWALCNRKALRNFQA